MNELEIAKNLIRILVCYGIVKNWSKDELFKMYEQLGIPMNLVKDTLCEQAEQIRVCGQNFKQFVQIQIHLLDFNRTKII